MGEIGVDLLIVPLEAGGEDEPPVGYGMEELGLVPMGEIGVDLLIVPLEAGGDEEPPVG